MFEKLKVSCSCFGTPKPKKQQIFITRKRQSQETQSPQSVIRFTNATQVINEIEGNGIKKSLKKRQGTYVHHDYNYFMIDEAKKAEAEIQSSQLKLPMKNKNFLKKGAQTPMQSYSKAMPFNYSGTSSMIRQSPLENNHNYFMSDTPEDFHYVIHEPHYLNYTQNQRSNIQLRPQVPDLQNQNTSLNYTSSVIFNQTQDDRVFEKELQTSVVLQKMSKKQILSNHDSFIRSKSLTLQSEPWSKPSQDHSLIEDFQKLFKNAQDSNFSKISMKEKNASFSREAQKYQAEKQKAEKQKAHQQRQKLMGRLAESEDEALSEAPHSQIIGKGFDIIYQDLLDSKELFIVEETKASRSTNTKVSYLRGQKHIFEEHQRMRFGKPAHLTSYGHL